ncbi:hypothetical protein [Herbidospora mongoliensis]|uniref:hypothetical protein n=1 Tax=Herbidospora mongoliensis TaxID=688067 RepID=UPI000832BE0D|nr:hypothetical protein [Herbidospora mongoliensis]
MAPLLVVALVAVPALTTAAPPDCRIPPFTDAEYLARQDWIMEEFGKEQYDVETPIVKTIGDSKPGVVPAIGVERLEPDGCPDLSVS